MLCSNCSATYTTNDLYCRHCGADLTVPSTSLVPTQTNLPVVLQNAPLSRSVAASVGAVALGVGIELLRRSLLARLAKPSRTAENTLPMLNSLKDILMPQNEKKPLKMPKGRYEVEETVVYMRRMVRRQN